MNALGFGKGSFANGRLWHYDDGGGNYAELVLLDGGRAVLYGHDHEYSETYFREAAAYFEEEETDLLAGAPPWWGEVLPQAEFQWIGFVYGYEDGAWARAAYEPDDGFASLALPAASEERLIELVNEFVTSAAEDQGFVHVPDPDAVLALVAAGPALTREQLAAVLGPIPADPDAGTTAARAFGTG